MRLRKNRQRGYTLMEILIVLAISTVVMMVAYNLIEDAMRTSLFVESHNNLSQWAQRPVNFMQTEVYQNKTIFDATTLGNGYLTRFTTPPAYPGAMTCGTNGCGGAATTPPTMPTMLPNSLLPVTDQSNVMGPDTAGNRTTGNILFLVRQLPPLLISYDNGAGTVNFPADRYRFEMYYLARDTSRSFSSATSFLDLIQVRSIDFADYFQLNPLIGSSGSFTAAQKTAIVNGLTAAKIKVAWDPMNQPVANAFYSIGATGTMTLQATQGIWVYSAKSMIPEFKGGAISGKMLFSVMFRPTATTYFVFPSPVPKYAIFNTSTPEFPSGFEVKIVGAGGSRKVLLRLVLMSNFSVSKYDWQEGFVISSS